MNQTIARLEEFEQQLEGEAREFYISLSPREQGFIRRALASDRFKLNPKILEKLHAADFVIADFADIVG